LETREPSCVPRVAKPFFIHVVHSPSGAVGHVAAPEFPSREGIASSRGTCGTNSSVGVNPHGRTEKVKLLLNNNHLKPQAVKPQRHRGDDDLM
jgi:hypothetical protein